MAELLNYPLAQFAGLIALRLLAKVLFPTGSLSQFLMNIGLFAALTALLFYHGIAPYVARDVDNGVTGFVTDDILKTLWWVGGAMVLISSVRMFLILEQKPREGRLLQDLVIALIYVGAAFCIFAYVFRLPVGTLITTSGVFAIALGLALQSTLNDVFSGIALNLNRPLSVGDWVVLDDSAQGRVIETNWRSTQFQNGTGDLVVVPNSMLAKSKITNLSVPNASHGAALRIRILPTVHPSKILEVMEKVALSSNEILKSPKASAAVVALDRDAVEIEISFRVADITRVAPARSELFDLVYRHSEAAGLRLATSSPSNSEEASHQAEPTDHLKRFMNLFSLFDGLTDKEKIDLASNMNRLVFKAGEVIAHKGSTLTSLMLMKGGVAGFYLDEGKSKIEFGRIAPGDLFGERGVLLGTLQVCDVRAISAVIICEIPKPRIAAILKERPAIAEELALLLSARTKAEDAAHENGISQHLHNVSTLRTRIRHLFHLP